MTYRVDQEKMKWMRRVGFRRTQIWRDSKIRRYCSLGLIGIFVILSYLCAEPQVIVFTLVLVILGLIIWMAAYVKALNGIGCMSDVNITLEEDALFLTFRSVYSDPNIHVPLTIRRMNFDTSSICIQFPYKWLRHVKWNNELKQLEFQATTQYFVVDHPESICCKDRLQKSQISYDTKNIYRLPWLFKNDINLFIHKLEESSGIVIER